MHGGAICAGFEMDQQGNNRFSRNWEIRVASAWPTFKSFEMRQRQASPSLDWTQWALPFREGSRRSHAVCVDGRWV